MKALEEQITAMRTRHPAFRLVEQTGRVAIWQGRLSPTQDRDFHVQISYRPPVMAEMFTIGAVQPQVRVLNPVLEQHPHYEEGPIPHVYWDADDAVHPVLCLFSLDGHEWGLSDLIADTTVFWASRWLYFYEGWLVTRTWKGGGRHPKRADAKEKSLETV